MRKPDDKEEEKEKFYVSDFVLKKLREELSKRKNLDEFLVDMKAYKRDENNQLVAIKYNNPESYGEWIKDLGLADFSLDFKYNFPTDYWYALNKLT